MRKFLSAALALLGFAAIAAPASAQMVNTQTGATYTFVNSDCDPQGRKIVAFNSATQVVITATLPAPGTASTGAFSNCAITIQDLGALPVVISGTVDGNTNVQVPGNSVGLILTTDGTAWHKTNYPGLVFGANLLDNGDFQIDQQYEGGGNTLATGTSARAVDRWWGTFTASTSGAGSATPTRAPLATGLTLTAKELKITMGTASTTQPAGLIGYIDQSVEGYGIADLQFGTAAALPQTYSGWIKTSIAGTWSIFVQNGGGAVSYVTNCATAAATWTFCTGTIPGDTAGNWSNTPNTIGEVFGITWTCGSTFQAAAPNAWSTGAFNCTSAQTLLSATLQATMELALWKLERGTVATAFQPDSLPVAMTKAKHWYRKSFNPGTPVAQNAGIGKGETPAWNPIANGYPTATTVFDVPMYHITSPTVTTYSPAAATAVCYDVTGTAAISGTPTTVVSDTAFSFQCGTVATGAHEAALNWTVDTGY